MGYTLKDAAEAVGITKNALKSRLKHLPPDAIYTVQKGKQTLTMVTDDGVQFLKEMVFECAPSKPISDTEKPILEPKTDSKPIETDFKSSKTDFESSQTDFDKTVLMAAMEALQKQLDEKDRQIASLTNALTATAQALATAQESLKAEQLLHAGTIRRELQAAAPEQEKPEVETVTPPQPAEHQTEEPQKKKKSGWLGRFFK